MKKTPKLSIIVPVYNAEKYIDRCMKSIYSQTFKDYEIILVNDGSKDNSDSICREYEKNDDRVTYIKKENEGAGSARNAGIEVAKGKYLAFPDVDDWFEPDMYEELYNLAESGDYDVVFSGINFYKQENGKIEYSRTQSCDTVSYKTQSECRKNVMTFFPTSTIFDSPCNKFYKRSVTIEKNVRFSDTRRCQDAMFNIDFYNSSQSAASTDKAFYNYIENTAESTNRKFPINYIDINIAYFEKLIGILSSWGIYEGDIKKHYDTSFIIAVYGTMNMYDNPIWGLSNKEQKKYIADILKRGNIQKFIDGADVREDAKFMADIIKEQNLKKIIRLHRIECLKEKIRKNRFLITLYRKIKMS